LHLGVAGRSGFIPSQAFFIGPSITPGDVAVRTDTLEGAMRVADIMQTGLETIGPDDSIAQAVEILADKHISGLPVVSTRGQLIGVVSTTDVLQLLAETSEPEHRAAVLEGTQVADIMTAKPITVAPDEDIHEAARQMLYGEIHRLFVEYDGTLVGVVTQSDIVGAVAGAVPGAKL
jgi:CBS domain-containing protein